MLFIEWLTSHCFRIGIVSCNRLSTMVGDWNLEVQSHRWSLVINFSNTYGVHLLSSSKLRSLGLQSSACLTPFTTSMQSCEYDLGYDRKSLRSNISTFFGLLRVGLLLEHLPSDRVVICRPGSSYESFTEHVGQILQRLVSELLHM